MGKDQKLQSDPARAKDHAAGIPVTVIQTLAHSQLGTIGYSWPRHWVFHAHAAEAAAKELIELHQRLVSFPVSPNTAIRAVDDLDYIESVYRAGVRMVTEAVLALQHLCEEIERTLRIQFQESTLGGRLREALEAAQLATPADRPGYAKFVELAEVRDAIEHPKGENTYNGTPGQWDRVPLAWFLSDRGIMAFWGCAQFMRSIVEDWESRKKELDGPAELSVQRGIFSQRQFKKPPTGTPGC